MYLIATSDEQNPSQFVFRPEVPIDLTGGYEVAVKSVSHGPSSTFNVTEVNNSFSVYKTGHDPVPDFRDYSIPPGYYRNGEQLLLAMQRAITTKEMYNSVNGSKRWYIPDYTVDETTNICSLTYNDSSIRFGTSQNSLLRSFKNYIKVSPLNTLHSQISAKIEDFPRHAKLGYIYSSIASSDMTRMDYRRKEKQHSGFLAMFLLEEKLGYNHYEFVNPSYFCVMSKSFSEIKFEICDNTGKLFEFSEDDARDFPTSMLLHLRRTS
eukprot:sb/3468330/